nr:HAD-IIB family hydrolase [Afifella pfennigii]
MRPLSSMEPGRLRAVDFVLTDIDDTLTTGGRLPALAYAAMERLNAAGLTIVPVTGRPAGWCDLIARLWPVDAVVGENGAFYFAAKNGSGVTRVFHHPPEERRRNRARLDSIAEAVLADVPASRLAADQVFREADLAIDFAEDLPRLSEAEIDRIVACFEAAGAHAKVSSIHVNGWFGEYDKLAMTRRLFQERYGLDIAAQNEKVLFVGDSPNDAPMFGFFDNSVAVANFARFRQRAEELPRWLTREEGGAGFAELAEAILAARKAP